MSRSTRAAAVLAALLLLVGLTGPAGASARPRCSRPVLVLSAMPLELNPLVRRTALTSRQVQDGRTFYRGRLTGVDVVLAMTGIGPANARATTQAAQRLPGCGFAAAVFSGVAGSRGYIGDVAIPRRWTADGGRSWTGVDPALLHLARSLPTPRLSQDVPVGDAACACPGVDAATPAHLPHVPVLRVGGDGTTSDPFGGRAAPCVPGGGDIAGCEPCLTAQGVADNTTTFAAKAAPLADPAFLSALLQPPAPTSSTADAQDEETAAVLQVLHRARVPFLGMRGVSDGQGDPLGLPGFPVQFAVYRQLAADNAATVTVAFLRRWAAEHTGRMGR